MEKSSSDGYRTSETRAGAGPAQNTEPATPEEGAAPQVDESRSVAGADDVGVDALLERVARMIRLEIVEPARALPLLSCEKYPLCISSTEYELRFLFFGLLISGRGIPPHPNPLPRGEGESIATVW